MLPLPRRLDKFVREATGLPLARVRASLLLGEITCTRLGVPGDPLDGSALIFDDDVVSFGGERLQISEAHVTLVLNKPPGVTSTTKDPNGRGDLAPFLARMPHGVFPVGRLDRDTTGALLFTSDGELASMVLRPEHELEKEYWLWLDEVLTPDDSRLAQCLSGVPMLGGIGRASRVTVVHAHEHTTELCLGLREGKNRQIRRICTALDLRLVHLHRKSIGPVTLDGIPPGSFRILTSAEVDALSLAAGGRNAVEARRLGALVALARAERAAGTPHARLERWLDEAKVEVASERTKASPQALSLG